MKQVIEHQVGGGLERKIFRISEYSYNVLKEYGENRLFVEETILRLGYFEPPADVRDILSEKIVALPDSSDAVIEVVLKRGHYILGEFSREHSDVRIERKPGRIVLSCASCSKTEVILDTSLPGYIPRVDKTE